MKYSDYIKQGNKVSYHGIPVMIDEILDVSHEYYFEEEEIDKYPSLCHVGIIYEDNKVDTVTITELSPLRHMEELSFNEYKTLWRQIEIGAMNYSSYRNSLGVDRKEVAYYSDGFSEALNNESEYPNFTENNAENFALYCSWCD